MAVTEIVLEKNKVKIYVDVENTGDQFPGKEVVQLYVADHTGAAKRPLKELKGYEKVALNPGETKTVTMTLDKRSFAWYSTDLHDWYAATGEYEIMIGASSRDIRLTKKVCLTSTVLLPLNLNMHTPLGELLKDERTRELGKELQSKLNVFFGPGSPEDSSAASDSAASSDSEASEEDLMSEAIAASMPIRSLVSFGLMKKEDLLKKLAEFND